MGDNFLLFVYAIDNATMCVFPWNLKSENETLKLNVNRVGSAISDFQMSNVECTGNEMSIEDCPHTDGNMTCSRNEVAGVECSGYDGMIRKLRRQFLMKKFPDF